MPNPPPRRRFQIHLSTAIVLMFVAGALIWANVHVKDVLTAKPFFSEEYSGQRYIAAWYRSHGFPLTAGKKDMLVGTFEWEMNYLNAAFNVIFAILILFCAWYICEYLIRRRASRKDA